MRMRIARFLAVAAAVVAALALLAWFLRDYLIERISNPLLQEYDVVVTDVSLDALASKDARIGYLELVYDNDTTIAIENLTLPLRATTVGSKIYAAEKVTVFTSAREDRKPVELARVIDQLLSLPDKLANNELHVEEFVMTPFPIVRDMRWVLQEDTQTLHATIASIEVTASLVTTGEDTYSLELALPASTDEPTGHFIRADLRRGEPGFSLNGTSSLVLPAWSPLAKLTGIIPEEIRIESGTATLSLDVDVPYDATTSPSARAHLAPSTQWRLAYAHGSGEMTNITVESGSPLKILSTIPGADWSLRQTDLSLRVTYDEWQDIPLTINDVLCKPGPSCSMSGRIEISGRKLPIGEVNRVELSFLQDITFPDDGVRVDMRPGTTLDVQQKVTRDVEVRRLEARLVSAASFEIVDAGWRFAADSLDGNLKASVGDTMIVTPLFLENIVASELSDALSLESGVYIPNSRAIRNKRNVGLPGMKGDVSLQGARVAADLETIGLHQEGRLEARHDLDTRTGTVKFAGGVISFATQRLSDRVSPWRGNWDLIAGNVAVDLDADWQRSGPELDINGTASMRFTDLAGNYEDTAFAGLSTELDLGYRADSGLATEPSEISVALIEMGIPIENISAGYWLDVGGSSIAVESLEMSALGGVVHADPFSFHTERASNTLLLHAESIELDTLLTLREFEAVEVSGVINGKLPVTITGNAITIEGGTFSGVAPGGVIRYLPDTPPDENDVSSVALVRRALSNFEYESLTSDVDYSKDGDLKLKLRLTGRNPDMDENRPIVLNLGVENNVLQMLRSLRAARAVEEILERRLQQKPASQPGDRN